MFNKKLIIAMAAVSTFGLALPAVAQSGCPGVYIGGQLGWGQVDHHRHHRDGGSGSGSIARNRSGHDDNNDGLAGRAYLGYQFNQYIGLETGFAGFSNDGNHDSHHHNNTPVIRGDHHDSDDWKVRNTQWDLLARFGTPFADSGFRGDVKLGAAAIFRNDDDNNRHHHSTRDHHGDNNDAKFGPAAGAGVSYSFNQNVAVDVSYLHVFGNLGHDHHGHHDNRGRGGDDHNAPNTDLVTLGVSYLFVMS